MRHHFSLLLLSMALVTTIKAQATDKKNTDYFEEFDSSKTVVNSNSITTSKSVESLQNTEGASVMMLFDKKIIDFGKIKFGESRTHIFMFKNNSNEPLNIDLVSACDCTEVDYTRTTIPVGGAGFIKAIYYGERTPEAINGSIHKDITIILKNQAKDTGYPIIEELFIKAEIVE